MTPVSHDTNNLMLDLGALTAAVGEQPDREAAWRFLRAFARDWSRLPLTDDDGYPDAELDAAEARLGLKLPAALREAYRLLGRRKDLTDNQDQLLAPRDIDLDDDRGVLVFRVENQSCAYWGVRAGDLDQDDPPVVIRPDVVNPTAAHWTPWLGRVSVTFIEIALSEALVASEDLTAWIDADGQEIPEDLAETFLRLPIPQYPLGQEIGTRWHAHDEVLIREDAGVCLQVRARTEQAMARFDAMDPGEDEDEQ
jgi:hypothetical protein